MPAKGWTKCRACEGTGDCNYCMGSGETKNMLGDIDDCPMCCDGACTQCGGQGWVKPQPAQAQKSVAKAIQNWQRR